MERRNIAVPKAHGGEAVARILHDGLNVPHNTAKGLIDAGCVTINGRPARSHGQRCEGGDVVEVRFDPERRYEPRPQPRHGQGFRVIHEDLEIVVVDKMPGILSSPAPGRRDESLAELIAESLRARGIKKPQLFVVHRLDQHTSGLLAFARTPRAMEWMAAQFESREAGRVYTAVVSGRVERERGTIQSWLVEEPKSLSVHTTPTRGAGKRAITHFAVQERFEDATLVRVGLETGRKHQIRVHFAEIGHPVLGDRRYGDPSPVLARVALHAERLTFRHPRTLERVTFEAPWPEDLTKLVQRLRRTGAGRPESGGGPDTARAAAAPVPERADAAPRAGSPFGRNRIPEVVARADAERFAAARPEGRRGPHGTLRVSVFPQGLTLTDPMGPTAAHLMDPIGGQPERAPHAHAPRASASGPAAPRGAASRGPRDERPARGERPASEGFDKRDRLLRQRSVGNRPPQRRRPSGSDRPPEREHTERPPEREPAARTPERRTTEPSSERSRAERPPERSRTDRPSERSRTEPSSERGRPSWTREPQPGGVPPRGAEAHRPAARPAAGKRWAGKPEGGRPGAGKPDGAKRWMGKPGGARPSSERPEGGKPWAAKREGAKPWAGKPRDAKPWSGKPPQRDAKPSTGKSEGGKPWAGKPRDAKPWAGKPRDAKPWTGKSEGGKPWAGKPRDAKPWAGKSEGGKPWAGKPRDAKPWAGKSEGAKPWAGKPRDAKPWAGKSEGGKPWAGKPRDAKAWAGKSEGAKPWAGKPRDAKPWAGKTSGKPSSGPPAAKSGAPSASGAVPHKARRESGVGAEARKPWEFKQKGSTLRREKRRKIASSKSKRDGGGKKP